MEHVHSPGQLTCTLHALHSNILNIHPPRAHAHTTVPHSFITRHPASILSASPPRLAAMRRRAPHAGRVLALSSSVVHYSRQPCVGSWWEWGSELGNGGAVALVDLLWYTSKAVDADLVQRLDKLDTEIDRGRQQDRQWLTEQLDTCSKLVVQQMGADIKASKKTVTVEIAALSSAVTTLATAVHALRSHMNETFKPSRSD